MEVIEMASVSRVGASMPPPLDKLRRLLRDGDGRKPSLRGVAMGESTAVMVADVEVTQRHEEGEGREWREGRSLE